MCFSMQGLVSTSFRLHSSQMYITQMYATHLQHFISCCVSVFWKVGRPQSEGKRTHTHVHYSRYSSQEIVTSLLTHWHKYRKGYSLLLLFTCAHPVSACHNSSPFSYRMSCVFLICNTNIIRYSNAGRIEFTSTKTVRRL